ncbi:hypothetical protein [Pseudohalioglobus lutimaris]|nr:hypothetical protein [Pseudohalioglobus lutimaris]
MIIINREGAKTLLSSLGSDFGRKNVVLYFVVVAALIVVVNIPTVLGARASQIDNRDFLFKLFFLFEDFLFLSVAACLVYTIVTRSVVGLLLSIGMVYFVYLVFNRFGMVATAVLVWFSFFARDTQSIGVSRGLPRGGTRSTFVTILVVLFAFSGLFIIEAKRHDHGLTAGVSDALVDRVGEFATLEVVDKMYSARRFDGFDGFENLKYLYLPAVFFPNKPIINDGSVYLRERFGMGTGYSSTRFPILLHNDAFRRFGWWGIICGLLPSISLYVMIRLSLFLRRVTGVPLLSLLTMKLAIFIYPKSILGLVEVTLYTSLRSAVVILAVYLGFLLLKNSPPIGKK